MKAITRTGILFAALMTLASTAFAAGASSQSSGIFVWVFLGFCGLIVATQLIPALMLLVGMVKAVTTSDSTVEQTNK
jgi:ABC-type multidrug transport system permease subunit